MQELRGDGDTGKIISEAGGHDGITSVHPAVSDEKRREEKGCCPPPPPSIMKEQTIHLNSHHFNDVSKR